MPQLSRERKMTFLARMFSPRMRFLITAIWSIWFCFPCAAAPAQSELVLWLLPADPGLQPSSADTTPTDEDVDRLNADLVPKGVVLENTSDPRLRTQLGAWNPEFAVPNLAWLRGQTVTLKALAR